MAEYLKHILFPPGGAAPGQGGPRLAETGSANFARETFRFSKWQAACHALWSDCWDIVKREKRLTDQTSEVGQNPFGGGPLPPGWQG